MNGFIFPVMTDYERQLPFYAKMIAIDHPLACTGNAAGLGETTVVLLRSGTATLLLQNGEQKNRVSPGQLVLIRHGQSFEWITDADTKADSMMVNGPQAEAFLDLPEIALTSGVWQLTDADEIHQLFLRLHDVAASPDRPDPAGISSGTYALLTRIAQQAAANVTSSLESRYSRLKPVLDYIVEHYAESITLKTLSDLLNVTPQHLCTLFRKTMHSRVFEFINLYRISVSKRLLADGTDRSIRDIAGMVGFDDVSYYCFIFKRFEKVTPGEFRKSLAC